jgi:hypothetical protein
LTLELLLDLVVVRQALVDHGRYVAVLRKLLRDRLCSTQQMFVKGWRTGWTAKSDRFGLLCK